MGDVPVLMCTSGALEGQRFRVPEGGLKIGRADENDVVIREDGVSRFHAELLFQEGTLWLQDAGSRNGVFVNDARVVGHQQLKVGDRIKVAEHTFELAWEDEAPALRPPPEDGDDKKGAKRRWFWPFS